MNLLIHQAMSSIVPQLSFYKGGFGIKYTRKVDMPLNKEIKFWPSQMGVWRIHRLILCRGVRIPEWVSCYDSKQSDGEVPEMQEFWGMLSTYSLPSLPCQLWHLLVALDRVLFMGQIELNYVLMQSWIAWNRTDFYREVCSYAKHNCLKWNYFCMLNWIVQNRTVFVIETVYVCKTEWFERNRTKTELFEIELL